MKIAERAQNAKIRAREKIESPSLFLGADISNIPLANAQSHREKRALEDKTRASLPPSHPDRKKHAQEAAWHKRMELGFRKDAAKLKKRKK
ncbi:MAG: hypothetical protein NUV67_04210 [archaeon]|nr:hypothetical protein [archaeon]